MVKKRDGVDKQEAMEKALELNGIKVKEEGKTQKHIYVVKDDVVYELRGMKKRRIRTLIRKIRKFFKKEK